MSSPPYPWTLQEENWANNQKDRLKVVSLILYDVQREHNCIVRKFNLFSTPTLGWSLDEEPGPAHVVQVTLKLSQ